MTTYFGEEDFRISMFRFCHVARGCAPARSRARKFRERSGTHYALNGWRSNLSHPLPRRLDGWGVIFTRVIKPFHLFYSLESLQPSIWYGKSDKIVKGQRVCVILSPNLPIHSVLCLNKNGSPHTTRVKIMCHQNLTHAIRAIYVMFEFIIS